MKKVFAVLFVATLVVAFAVPAMADLSGYAQKKVFVNVDPDVAVSSYSESGSSGPINLGSIQRGTIYGHVNFRVDANKEQVALQVLATDLYKGDDPTNDDVPPIPLCSGVPVVITPTNANPINSGTNRAGAVGFDFIDNWPATKYQTITFESSQNGHFSQDIDVKVCWEQEEVEKPTGQYSGLVKLCAMIGSL
jgi:hypothetical protein